MNEVELKKQVEDLKEVAARSIDPCLTAKFIAFSDARVQALFLTKTQDGNLFKGVRCLGGLSIPENRSVYFDFDCPADRVCLVKPAFVVVVNIVNGYIVAIIDPYTGATEAIDSLPLLATVKIASPETGGAALRFGGTNRVELSDGTLPLAGGGTLPLSSDGTLPLAGGGTLPLASDGTLPLRAIGYVLLPAGWRFGNG